MTRAAACLLVLAPLTLGGCLVLMQVPGMVDEMRDLSVSGIEFFRHEGVTRYREPYRVTYHLDREQKRRYRVVLVNDKTLDSSWENLAAELEAGAAVWGISWHGRSEAEVKSMFGPPTIATDAGDVRTLWYMGRRDGAYGVVFRDGRLFDVGAPIWPPHPQTLDAPRRSRGAPRWPPPRVPLMLATWHNDAVLKACA